MKLYATVRSILDDFERAAPWSELYYPSTDDDGFLEMERAFLETLDGVPERIEAMTAELQAEATDDADRDMLGNASFFFEGIHGSVMPDLARFRAKLKNLAPGSELSSEDRDFVCEITADLKGKYTSSMMGAAASLIAEGRWNGVTIEPILFPEKAEEFERNEKLVGTLTEVIENITSLIDEVPLADMVKSWEERDRVDLYALTPLYSFLGNLGKLMKEGTRRALYSGDYHQIRKRERLLNTRINELTTLHNMTWASEEEPSLPDGGSPFPVMAQRATELAAILDVNILRGILGEKTVKDLLFIVTIEKDRARDRGEDAGISSMRRSIPEALHTLVPLLYDEDLQNFLGFLLGSVLKRASLALQREARSASPEPTPPEPAEPVASPVGEPAAEAPAPAPAFDLSEELMPELATVDELRALEEASASLGAPPAEDLPAVDLSALDVPDIGVDESVPAPVAGSTLDGGELLDPVPDFGALAELDVPPLEDLPAQTEPAPVVQPSAESGEVPSAKILQALGNLRGLLDPLLDRGNAHRKSFEMVHRLLSQRKTVPPAMLQSMHPFLYDVMNMLIPELNELDLREISGTNASKLFDYCTFLCDRHLTADQIRNEVPETMDKVLGLLEDLQAMTRQLIQDLSG